MLRADIDKPVYGSAEFAGRDAKLFTDACRRSGADVSASFHEVELAVANHDLVRRKVVVDVREMNVETL